MLKNTRLKQLAIRLAASTSIFALIIFFTPNFNLQDYPYLLISSISVVILDYIISVISEIHDVALLRCIVGFTSFILIAYFTGYLLSGFYLSFITIIIASIMYGIVEYYLPNN